MELFTISAEPERVAGGGEETRPEVQASMPESTAQPGARQPQPTALEERKSPLAASTVTTVQVHISKDHQETFNISNSSMFILFL